MISYVLDEDLAYFHNTADDVLTLQTIILYYIPEAVYCNLTNFLIFGRA